MTEQRKDLIVLVADSSTAEGLEALLQRHQSLRIKPISFDVRTYPQRDAGVFNRAHTYLTPFMKRYSYALVVLDYEGCGCEAPGPETVSTDVQMRLDRSGWEGRSRVILIYPELDIWVWSDSPHVDRVLGWFGRKPTLREWLKSKELLRKGHPKPERPKEARLAAMKQVGTRESSAIFEKLGSSVSVKRCTDPAFQLLLATLREWFPPA